MKDKEVQKLIKLEEARQKRQIQLIASESPVSQDVRTAISSVFTHKYAEGYPNARYYQGSSLAVDPLETLCQARALKTFKLNTKKWSVNVQPLSGSPANLAVYTGLLNVGDKIMGMNLSDGGHLTHGHAVSATGKFWKQISYGVSPKTETLDYDALMQLALKEKPAIIVTGYTAYPRKINFKKFREIADASGAILMVDMSHTAGLIAGGAYPSPFKYADVVTTTTHKTLRGPRSAMIFSKNDSRDLAKQINRAVFPGLQGGPHMNTIAGVAVALFEAQQPGFKQYAKQVVKNAKVLGAELAKLGWRLVSGGTDSHLLLIDTWLDGNGIDGKSASIALEKNDIIVNMNTIPFDRRKPMSPSGIRIGTAWITSNGLKEKDMQKLAIKINTVLRDSIIKFDN